MKRYRSLTLATWLSGGSMAILTLAVTAVAAVAIGNLRTMSEGAALAKAQLAGASSLEYLRGTGEVIHRTAQLLAARPSLQRHLLDGNRPQAEQLLQAFCDTSGLDACAAITGEAVIANVGVEIPWGEWREAHDRQGDQLLLAPLQGGPILLGAAASVPEVDGVEIVLARLINERFIGEIEGQVAATVRITSRTATVTDDKLLDLHRQVEAQDQPVALRIADLGVHATSIPLLDRSGSFIGFVDIALPTSPADTNLHRVALRFAVVAIAIVGLAGLGGLIFGNWLVRPVRTLEKAAREIGRGEFTPQVEIAGASEVAALARAMDEMRGNLRRLTMALRQREAEASAVLRGVMEGVFAVDMNRRIRYASPQLARMLNTSMDAMLGQFCGDVLQPGCSGDTRPCEGDCPIIAARTTKQQSQSAEQLRVPGQGLRSMVIVSAPPDGERQIQVLRDETDKEAASRARDGILANISHEFRTPLAAQLASLEVLDEHLETLSGPEQRQLIANLRRSGVRLMRLIDNLLESVRIEAGQLAIRQQRVDVNAVIEEAAAVMDPLLHQRHQRLVLSLAADMAVVPGDAQRLVQVFVNLLTNASKYAPEGTEIHIGTAAAGPGVRAWVEDSGPGIPEPDRGAVFQRFNRGTGGEPQAHGLGLGLWIARSIIERHHGTIEIQNMPEGKTRLLVTIGMEPAS